VFDDNQPNSGWVIVATLAAAFLLSVIPLPPVMEHGRPEWVALVLIYWVMDLPHRVGMVVAWAAGLLLDVMYGSVFGQHALSLSVMAFVTHVLHLRLRVYPVLQQSLIVVLLVGVHLLISLAVQTTLTGHRVSMAYWLPMLTSAMIWPWLLIVLRSMSNRFLVN